MFTYLRMQQHGVLLSGFELEVDVATVAQVEGRQGYDGVRYAERHRVAEEICQNITKK